MRMISILRCRWPLPAACGILFLFAAPALGQISPLPPVPASSVYLEGPPAWGDPAAYTEPSDFSEPLLPDADMLAVPKKPVGKPGMFQRIELNSTWIPRGDDDEYGSLDFELSAIFAFPMPTRESPMILKPGSDVHLLDGPNAPDLPAQVYDETLQIRWMSKLGENFGVDLSVTPGWHSDFESESDDGFRTTAHAIGAYDWSPTTKLVLGVLYLDSQDFDFFPAGGLIWTPDEDTKLELIIPRPRLARRTSVDCGVETWWYVAGEYGTGEWAITRAAGFGDTITASDYRAILGIERRVEGGINSRFEIGYVFGRQIEYLSGTPTIEPADTVMLRSGVWY